MSSQPYLKISEHNKKDEVKYSLWLIYFTLVDYILKDSGFKANKDKNEKDY